MTLQNAKARSRLRIVAVLMAVIFGAMVGWFVRGLPFGLELSLRSLSADDRWEAQLLEVRPKLAADRNFVLRVKDLALGTSRDIFSSPDEGRPEGSERIIWSEDSTRFLLAGRHFFPTTDKPTLTNGDALYLMYDVKTGELWCNASQAQLKHFTAADVQLIRWREPLILAAPTTRP